MYLGWQTSPFPVGGRACIISSLSNTYSPHCTYCNTILKQNKTWKLKGSAKKRTTTLCYFRGTCVGAIFPTTHVWGCKTHHCFCQHITIFWSNAGFSFTSSDMFSIFDCHPHLLTFNSSQCFFLFFCNVLVGVSHSTLLDPFLLRSSSVYFSSKEILSVPSSDPKATWVAPRRPHQTSVFVCMSDCGNRGLIHQLKIVSFSL